MDYSTYFLSKKEMMVCIGKGILAGMLAAWILYQSVYGMVTVFIFIPLCIQREKKKRREQQKETLLLQFRAGTRSKNKNPATAPSRGLKIWVRPVLRGKSGLQMFRRVSALFATAHQPPDKQRTGHRKKKFCCFYVYGVWSKDRISFFLWLAE